MAQKPSDDDFEKTGRLNKKHEPTEFDEVPKFEDETAELAAAGRFGDDDDYDEDDFDEEASAYGSFEEDEDEDWGEAEDDFDDQWDDEDDDSIPMIALVQLRNSLRYLEASMLAKLLSEAWNLRIDDDEEDSSDSDGFVSGESPLFIVSLNAREDSPAAMFFLNNIEENYFDEPDELADEVVNLRFAEIVRNHTSWLSLDLMRPTSIDMTEEDAYRYIGKAMNALADDDTLAVLCPEHEIFNQWTDALGEGLCGENPLQAMDEEYQPPVFNIDADDILAAIEEARRRWPEFVEHFAKRDPAADEPFLVKAAFMVDDDNVEHMWVQVFGMEPKYVHGYLANDPVNNARLKIGDQVEVPVELISDWACVDRDGNMLGNFTDEAVTRAAMGVDDLTEEDLDDVEEE